MELDLAEFWKEAARRKANSDERLGQAMFNTLNEKNRELALWIVGSEFDPFYDDERIPDFLDHIFP